MFNIRQHHIFAGRGGDGRIGSFSSFGLPCLEGDE